MIDARVIGTAPAGGKTSGARVSEIGELITRDYAYSEPYINAFTDTTVYNYIRPREAQQFIITGLFVNADRSIAAAGELFQMWEASTATSTTQDKLLFSIDIARQGSVGPSLPPIKITQGKYVNADTTQAAGTITASLFGYWTPRVD